MIGNEDILLVVGFLIVSRKIIILRQIRAYNFDYIILFLNKKLLIKSKEKTEITYKITKILKFLSKIVLAASNGSDEKLKVKE